MEKKYLEIGGIPAILWGEKSDRAYIAVHGKLSSKEDALGFAEIACPKGYQVLSFDLPEHGSRKDSAAPCDVWQGVGDLLTIGEYAAHNWKNISLYATSLGAYFSLLAYPDYPLENCLFVSPILDMERLIRNMMLWSGVDEKTLREKKRIPTDLGETLDWDYYCYVREHPVRKWSVPTAILYASKDLLTERRVVDDFSAKFRAGLTVMQDGEHWFHTEEQLAFLNQWLGKHVS